MKTKSSEIKDFKFKEISQKLFNRIINHQHISEQVREFDNKSPHNPFGNNLTFLLGKSMVRHQSSIEQIHWNKGANEQKIIEGIAQKEILSIINDYLNTESQVEMQRFMVNHDTEFKGKDLKYVYRFEYGLICTPDQLESYTSFLFSEENYECIISYYLDYIYRFPIQLTEFEKIFFYFLTILFNEIYPTNVTSGEVIDFVFNINEIVKMRYIDLKDRLIQTLIHLISIDDELLQCSNTIYADMKHHFDLLRDQFNAMAS